MSLPPELRNRIYEDVLTPENDGEGGVPGTRAIAVGIPLMDTTKRYAHEEWPHSHLQTTCWARQPFLTLVSKTVRAETLPVYYGMNHFVSCSETVDPTGKQCHTVYGRESFEYELSGTLQWLERIGTQNKVLVKNLEICHAGLPMSIRYYLPEVRRLLDETFARIDRMANNFAANLPSFATHIMLETSRDRWMPFCLEDPGSSLRRRLRAMGHSKPGSLAYREAEEVN